VHVDGRTQAIYGPISDCLEASYVSMENGGTEIDKTDNRMKEEGLDA